MSRYRQNFDENGYLTGGSRLSVGGASIGFGHSYSFHYGADGQIESYDIAQSREATLVRNQGRLDAINFYNDAGEITDTCLLYTSPSPRDATLSRMPSSA